MGNGRRSKNVELDPSDLFNMSVKEIDAQLSMLWRYAGMALGLRRQKAAEENVDTPPPEFTGMVVGKAADNIPRINEARRAVNTLPDEPPKPVTFVAGSSVHTAYTVIDRYPRGVDSMVFREAFEKMYTGNDGPASYARALQRLKGSDQVVIYKKKLFTYWRLKQFLDDVRSGATEDFADEHQVVRGKWSTTILEFVRGRQGAYVDFGEIVDHVMRQPGFENVNNASSQVAVALRNLLYRHKSIEKMKGHGKSQYRYKLEDQKDEPPTVDLEASTTAH